MLIITPETYTAKIAGETFRLPIMQLNERRAISLLMVIDMGVRFGDMVGKAMARHFAASKPDIVVGSATLGIPIAIEVSRRLGKDRYVILQKSPKFHLADAMVEEVRSVTTSVPQRLLLDRRCITLLQGKRVLIVDDVVATGSSMAAAIRLVRRSGAEVMGAGVILTEGHSWRAALGRDAELVNSLGHIPQFDIVDGAAVPDPSTEANAKPALLASSPQSGRRAAGRTGRKSAVA
ncbi:phosphoribosyltransferase family protein [Bradyrhizobium sp. AZCC 2230]|uniref:phosphoribosyltransferase family protein n=1 Tax=Bradyrhizobium sp. AZCC 2230 TaxID=3117021 RepID=UPI002FF11A68